MLKINRLFLKFVERERKVTFFRRHPQLSFLSVALLLGVFACQGIAEADDPTKRISEITARDKIMILTDSAVSVEADHSAFVQLAMANRDDYTKALQVALPALADADSLPLYGATPIDPTTTDPTLLDESAAAVNTTEGTTDHLTNNILVASVAFSEQIANVVTEAADDLVVDADSGTPSMQPILDVPFDAETQQRILKEACNGDLRMFCLAMTIAKKESEFVPNLIGDNGLSYGYYQIKTNSHADRIAKYGFSNEDLFDPVKGAIVCVDYLRELLWTYQKSGEVGHFLFMMYNQGPGGARNSVTHMVNSTEYSRKAMAIYESYLAQAGLESGVPFEP